MTNLIESPLAADFNMPKAARRPLRPPTLASARRRLSSELARAVFQVADLAALGVIALAAPWPQDGLHGLVRLLAPIVMVVGLRCVGAYRFPRGERLLASLSMTVVAAAAAYGLLVLAAEALSGRRAAAPDLALAAPALGVAALLHAAWFALMKRWRGLGLLTPNIAIIGATPTARQMILELINGHGAGEANVIGIFDDRHKRAPKEILGVPVLGPVDDLLNHRALASVERIVITVPEGAVQRIAELMKRLSALPHEIVLVAERGERADAARLGGLNLTRIGGRSRVARRAFAKRVQDLVIGGLAVVAASPIFLAVALAVKLDSPGPVFFRQKRHGFNNEEIWVLKFRSMRTECADATAARQVSADDDRITRVGRFIRKTSLDELPQLLNVLRGEMSLVGPRPHAVGMKSGGADAASLVNSYSHRHRMKPGLTGLAAINGSRGPVDDAESLSRRVMLDLAYIERQSFWLDLWILLRTAPLVLGDSSATR